MKYTLIDEKRPYALILRGESMTQYAVVSGLDKETGSWDWSCCYYHPKDGKDCNRRLCWTEPWGYRHLHP